MRTALLALIVGVLATGCVVTTGGEPSTTGSTQHFKAKPKKSKRKSKTEAQSSQTVVTTGGGEAVAAPPVATPTPGAQETNTAQGTQMTTRDVNSQRTYYNVGTPAGEEEEDKAEETPRKTLPGSSRKNR